MKIAAWIVGSAFLVGCAGAIDGDSSQPASEMSGAKKDPAARSPAQVGGPEGSPGGPDPAAGSPAGKPAMPPGTVAACSATAAPRSRLRRLTGFEYDNSILELLGITAPTSDVFEPENLVLGFDNNPSALITNEKIAGQYESAAEVLARAATRDLPKLMGCDAAKMGEEECARSFIAGFGRRAFRMPLPAEEATAFFDFYKVQKQGSGFPAAIEAVVSAFLQSPAFVYRFELAPETPAALELSGHAMASRLSYFLWGAPPDRFLSDAADSGKLGSRGDAAREARRMLKDPRARAQVDHMHAMWLELGESPPERDGKLFPKYAPVAAQLREETRQFLGAVLVDGDGTLTTMFSAPFTYANKAVAGFYGLMGPAGNAFEKVMLDPSKRLGVLTQASVMASHATRTDTSIPRRGKFVLEKLLCIPVPPPLPDAPPLPPTKPGMGGTQRQRLEMHTAPPACSGCHSVLNPAGFAFERLGADGGYRDLDNGAPIDTSSALKGTLDIDGPIASAPDLVKKLASSAQAQTCAMKQWVRYGLGRGETDGDACVLAALTKGLAESGGNVREFLIQFVQSDAFLSGFAR